MDRIDVAIIGSGPAGIEAAINLKIRKKSFLLFGTEQMSRKLMSAPRVDNYLGFPGISGADLQAMFQKHMDAMDIAIRPQQVQMIYHMGDHFSLAAGSDTFEATSIILATGISHEKLFAGEEAFLGRGVGYCATCDAPLYRGKTVTILGYTEEAVHEANYVAELAAKVYYVPMVKTETPLDGHIRVLEGKVSAIEGDTIVRSIRLDGQTIPTDGVFILRDSVKPSALIPGLDMHESYIKVTQNMETNIPGCYAAGDCTGKPHQFMRAAGQGQTAALAAVAYLDNLKKSHKLV